MEKGGPWLEPGRIYKAEHSPGAGPCRRYRPAAGLCVFTRVNTWLHVLLNWVIGARVPLSHGSRRRLVRKMPRASEAEALGAGWSLAVSPPAPSIPYRGERLSRRTAEGKIDAWLGLAPVPEELRARNIGHIVEAQTRRAI